MNNVKQLRKKAGLSQAELAQKLSVHQTLISQIERGTVIPSGATLVDLADFFNVSTDYVLGRRPSTSSVAGHILAIADYRHISLETLAEKIGIFSEELDKKLFGQKDSELAADEGFLKNIAAVFGIEDYTALIDDDTYGADTYENYIAFLRTKMEKGFPLTQEESDFLRDDINSDPSNTGLKNVMPFPRMRRVPLIGTIACGTPILAIENLEESVNMPDDIKADFALLCKGESMKNARINDGDIAYIRQQPNVENGQIAAVQIDDEVTLKRVYFSGNRLILQPENPAFQPIILVDDEIASVRILGLAVAFTSVII